MPPKRNKKSSVQEEVVRGMAKKTKTASAKNMQKTKPITKKIIQNTFLKNRNSCPRLPSALFDKILEKKTINDEHFQCVLCYTMLIEPKLTKCGHTFCKKCIHQSLLYRTSCPVCKTDLKNTCFIANTAIEHSISQKLADKQEQRKQYENDMKNYQSWFDEKKLDLEELAEGTIVDIRDKDYYWVSGKVIKIQDQSNQLVVRFTRNHSTHTETLDINSQRLARENSILGLKQIRKVVQERYQVPRMMSRPTFSIRNSLLSRPLLNNSGLLFQRENEDHNPISPPFRMVTLPNLQMNRFHEPPSTLHPLRLDIDSVDPEPHSHFWFMNLGDDHSPPPPSFF